MRRAPERVLADVGLGAAELAALLDAAVDAIVVIDEAGCVLAFNTAAERLFGRPAADVVGAGVAPVHDAAAELAAQRAGCDPGDPGEACERRERRTLHGRVLEPGRGGAQHEPVDPVRLALSCVERHVMPAKQW